MWGSSNYYQFTCLLCHMNRHWHSFLCQWCGLQYFERIPVSTVAYNCHSMKQFSWVTCFKTAVRPMTKQSSNLTYDKTAVWPMKKQFSNPILYKTAVAFLLYDTADRFQTYKKGRKRNLKYIVTKLYMCMQIWQLLAVTMYQYHYGYVHVWRDFGYECYCMGSWGFACSVWLSCVLCFTY